MNGSSDDTFNNMNRISLALVNQFGRAIYFYK